MTRPYTEADVELVARALADLAFGPEDDHAPWHYTEFGTACTCGAAIVADDRCTANWDHMPDEGKDNYRSTARTVLSALASAGRLTPGADSVDEHGNRIDTCGVCTLAPSVSGWARVTQARCPVHDSRPHAEPAVLSWDWREQPDLAQLARAVRDVSAGTVHVREVDTGSDQFAIVIAGTDLDEADTQAVYERWLHGGPPDTEEETDAA